jgi:hypothetical protein
MLAPAPQEENSGVSSIIRTSGLCEINEPFNMRKQWPWEAGLSMRQILTSPRAEEVKGRAVRIGRSNIDE